MRPLILFCCAVTFALVGVMIGLHAGKVVHIHYPDDKCLIF